MLGQLSERDTRFIVLAAAVAAAGLLYALRSRGPVRASTRTGTQLLVDRMDAPARPWRMIVIHHSATAGGNAAAMDRYHREVRGWRSLAYHFVIGNGHGARDGELQIGPRWTRQEHGAHAGTRELNRDSVGVCLVGNFEEHLPTESQMRSLRNLTQHLQQRYDIDESRVFLHRAIRRTKCPGKLFPEAAFRAGLR